MCVLSKAVGAAAHTSFDTTHNVAEGRRLINQAPGSLLVEAAVEPFFHALGELTLVACRTGGVGGCRTLGSRTSATPESKKTRAEHHEKTDQTDDRKAGDAQTHPRTDDEQHKTDGEDRRRLKTTTTRRSAQPSTLHAGRELRVLGV